MTVRAEPDWDALHSEMYGSFSPGSPVRVDAELAGRQEEAHRLRNIILGAGEHALIYGERGVGKTSIALTFWASLNAPTRRVEFIHVNCGDNDFTGIWRKVFRRMRAIDRNSHVPLDQFYPDVITPDDVEYEISSFGMNDLPLVLLDEFDKISDSTTDLLPWGSLG